MKSNQERSNECLPPKKRELAASTLASDDRPLATPPASDTQRNENLAWLASVAGGHEGRHRTTPSSAESNGPQYKPLSMSDSSPSYSSSSSASYASSSSPLRLVSSLPTIYTSATMAGALHYAPMPHNLQFIASPYPSPYAGYVSSQLLPPPPPPPPPISSSSSSSSPSAQHRVSHAEAASNSSQAPKPSEHHHHHHHQRSSIAPCTSMPPPSSDYHPVHGSSSSSHSSSLRTVQSPSHHHAHLPPPPPPPPLHAHHKLGRALSQLVVGYIPCRTEEGQARGSRELHNGEQERSRRPGSGMAKLAHKTRGTPPSTPSPSSLTTTSSSSSPYEAHQLVLPTDYTTHDPSVLRTSFMLMPNSHQDHAPQASGHLDKGGVGGGGKSAHRTLSSSSISSPASTFAFPPPLSVDAMKAPHTVIQTTHSATELLPTSGLYPQPPIISYIAGGGGGSQQQHQQQQQQQLQQQHHHQHHQQSISYHHASLQQHLLIPGSQPVIIPVSGGGVTTMESAASHATSAASLTFPAAALPPQTYIAGPKREPAERPDDAAPHFHQALRGQLRLTAAARLLLGSIIQLADGDLKRVEELKTEDFIQSAEVSGELKIDSSTVERIDESPASRHLAVVQFSVGEHRAQVSVEVLVEYPFFVFGQGWSSCCPDRTTQLLELPCARLSVGDVCISLALKNLRNGSLKKNQPRDPTTAAATATSSSAAATSAGGHGHLKPPARPGSRHGERENGVRQQQQQQQQTLGGGAAVKAENGMELRFGGGGDDPGSGPAAGAWKPTRGRKRRWSAPEGRKVDKAEEEEELPAALPRHSFLPHDVKVSIEGRSSFGK
ncbi:unnamed protein product [Merluccius merluccius]